MLCQICGNEEATVHFTEVINSEISELHLCESCAQKKGLSIQPQFSIADLLAGLINLGISSPKIEAKEIKCENCGLTYSQFGKIGRLGCSECYQTFEKALIPLLRKIHGSIQHRGKFPKKAKRRVTVKAKNMKTVSTTEELKAELTKAIAKEEFEKAAELRDKIKLLQKKAGPQNEI